MNIAYVRVSTVEQNEERQIEGLQKYSIDKWFTEKVSGKNTDRPQLQAMIEFAREGDTVYIHDFSRLARSTKDLLAIVETLNKKGVHLVSNKENVDSSTPTGKLMLTMIGAIAEFERENLLERQREGIAIAKREGRYKGRKPIAVDNFPDLYAKYLTREMTKVQLAKQLSVSRPTLDKLIKEYKENQPKAGTEESKEQKHQYKAVSKEFRVLVSEEPEFYDNRRRYVMIDTATGEVVDDAQGYGFETAVKAYKCWGYKQNHHRSDKSK